MAASYTLQILTPQESAYEGEVIHACIPVEDGLIGVLAHHAPYISSSPGGKLVLREKNGSERSFKIGPGFFEVASNRAFLLTQSLSGF